MTASTLSVFWATWNHVDQVRQRHRSSVNLTTDSIQKKESSHSKTTADSRKPNQHMTYVNTADCNKMQSGRCYLGRLWFWKQKSVSVRQCEASESRSTFTKKKKFKVHNFKTKPEMGSYDQHSCNAEILGQFWTYSEVLALCFALSCNQA